MTKRHRYPAGLRAAVVAAYWQARPRQPYRVIAAQWHVPEDLVRFWVTADTVAAENAALRTLLGTQLSALIVRAAHIGGEDPGMWARRELVAGLRRRAGLRRYAMRRRGLVQYGPVTDLIPDQLARSVSRPTRPRRPSAEGN